MTDDAAADSLTQGLAARLGLSRRQDPEVSDLEIWRARSARQHAKYASQRSADPADFSFREETRRSARQKAERARKADSTLIVELLSGLLRGELIGLLENQEFSDVRSGFLTALSELGRTVTPPSRLPENSASKSDLRTEMLARSLGVTPTNARKVAQSKPRVVRRFDDFAASLPAEPATLQTAIDAGNLDGLPAGFTDLLAALIGAARGAALSNDRAALEQVGEDFGAVAFALMAATGGTPETETSQRAAGYETRRKNQYLVEIAPNYWVDAFQCERGADGKVRLKSGAGTPELRKRIAAAQKA